MLGFVYWNLTKGCFSVKAMEGQHKGRVILHCSKVIITDAEFKVSEAGRQRVLKTGRKQVHAGVVGDVVAWKGEVPYAIRKLDPWAIDENWDAFDGNYAAYAKRNGDSVTYNPHRAPHFTATENTATGQGAQYATHAAEMVVMTGGATKAKGGKPEMRAFDPCYM